MAAFAHVKWLKAQLRYYRNYASGCGLWNTAQE